MIEQTLPNLIIAGVNKAGTTSLYAYLSQHPQIGASAIKETCHFLPLRYDEPMPGIDVYREQFKAVTDKPIRFESTPGYFYGGQSLIDGMREALGDDLKIILIFREPVSRLVSFFNFKKSTLELPTEMTLAEYVESCREMSSEALERRDNNPWFGLAGGRYADYLLPWVETFGDRVHILFADDLHQDPRTVLRGLCKFASVDTDPVDQIDLSIENKGTDYRFGGAQRAALVVNRVGEKFWRTHPRIKRTFRRVYYALNGRSFEKQEDHQTLEALREYYNPCNARFAQQLRDAGHDNLPEWLTNSLAGVEK